MEMSVTEKFKELFNELEGCDEVDQKQKIEEMKRMIDEMNEKEFESVFTTELFENIHKMIILKKFSLKDAISLLMCIGSFNASFIILKSSFESSSLRHIFEIIIIDEEKKKERKNERLLIDLCECCLLLNNYNVDLSKDLLGICIRYLLKVALKKEEDKETQKEVETAILALSCIRKLQKVPKELFLNEIKEIVFYQQEHHNLTPLASRFLWLFLMDRLDNDESLEDVFVNELHLAREVARELEELSKCVDWTRKEKEKENRGKEVKKKFIIRRFLYAFFFFFFSSSKLWNEEFIELIMSIVQVLRASRDNHKETFESCINVIETAAGKKVVKIEAFLKGGAVDAVLEEIQRPTLDDKIAYNGLIFFMNVLYRLKDEEKDEMEEAKRKATKMELFEKMEEEGYEDCIFGFCNCKVESLFDEYIFVPNVERLFVHY